MSYQLKLWDSKEGEKINRPEHTAGCSQNKGTEQVQRRARKLRANPALLETGGREVGKGAGSAPKDNSPYRTANRPPVSNQRPPETLDGRHPPGGSRRDTGRRHPTSTGRDWGRGHGGQKAHCTWGERARQAPGCLSRSAQKAHAAFCSALLWNTQGLEPRAAQGTLHIEQPGT